MLRMMLMRLMMRIRMPKLKLQRLLMLFSLLMRRDCCFDKGDDYGAHAGAHGDTDDTTRYVSLFVLFCCCTVVVAGANKIALTCGLYLQRTAALTASLC